MAAALSRAGTDRRDRQLRGNRRGPGGIRRKRRSRPSTEHHSTKNVIGGKGSQAAKLGGGSHNSRALSIRRRGGRGATASRRRRSGHGRPERERRLRRLRVCRLVGRSARWARHAQRRPESRGCASARRAGSARRARSRLPPRSGLCAGAHTSAATGKELGGRRRAVGGPTREDRCGRRHGKEGSCEGRTRTHTHNSTESGVHMSVSGRAPGRGAASLARRRLLEGCQIGEQHGPAPRASRAAAQLDVAPRHHRVGSTATRRGGASRSRRCGRRRRARSAQSSSDSAVRRRASVRGSVCASVSRSLAMSASAAKCDSSSRRCDSACAA